LENVPVQTVSLINDSLNKGKKGGKRVETSK
jgi:hypothetical protein